MLPKSTWDYIVQFWFLDLSKTDSVMQECYSVLCPVFAKKVGDLFSFELAAVIYNDSATREVPHSAFGFRLHYPIANSGIALKLMIYMDLHIFEINIRFGKPYKFGYWDIRVSALH